MADRIGQHFGEYRLVRLIGQGDFGEVYLGEHLRHSGQAAIKVLHTRLRDVDALHFLNEEHRIYNLKHPHIVRLLDYDFKDDIPFLIMDYLPKGTLRQRYPEGTCLPLADILSYVEQVANVLQYAHNHDVIHGDVKPQNMLIGLNDEILLSDFGLAIAFQSMSSQHMQNRAGTLLYMAPEQILGHPHPSSDQYALGVIVYEWLCGSCPFSGEALAVIYQHVHVPPLPLREKISAISPAIEQIVLRALAKDPRQRFATIEEFAQALEQADQAQEAPTLLTLRQPLINPISIVEPIHQRKGPSISRGMAMLLIGLALMLFVGSVAFFLSSSNKHSHATTATVTPAINAYNAGTASGVMAGFNAQHTHVNPYEKILTSANVSKLVLAWKTPTGDSIGSAATVANGIVYINSEYSKSNDGYMYALNVNTGAMLWKDYIGSYDFGCAPTVANGVVYMGSWDDNLYAYNARTGKILWRAPTRGRIGSSPTLANGVIYMGSDDHNLYAFEASTGKQLWHYPTGNVIRSSPAVANGIVYVGSDDGKLYAIEASTGKPLWHYPTGGGIDSSPTIANGVLFIGSNDHKLYAFNASGCGSVSCSPLWTASTGDQVRSSPTVANGVVYIGSDDGNLYAFHLAGTTF